ncbi:MAG: homoserine O-acetyltransferase [Actinomycetota bacterium]
MTAGGLGRTTTQRATLFTQGEPFVFESGASLGPVEVAYETYGELAPDRSNVVVICHALTGDAHAAGHHGDPSRVGWWDNLIGPGRPVDTDRFFVVSPNLLGGCQGTTGPASINPQTGSTYGLEFPLLTVRDLVGVHRALLGHLGIQRVHGIVGGSLGGMQALQWALDFPTEVDRCVLAGVSARLSAQNIGFSAVARTAIMRDPNFQNGEYAGSGVSPDVGLAVARMMAHLTYVSEGSLREKFDRRRQGSDGAGMTFATDFEVESYLDHQGRAFLDRFDALTYIYLSRVMDYFEPFADPSLQLAAVTTEFLLVSFDTDWRFPTEHSLFILDSLVAGGAKARHEEVASPWGHDSFLLDVARYHEIVGDFLVA